MEAIEILLSVGSEGRRERICGRRRSRSDSVGGHRRWPAAVGEGLGDLLASVDGTVGQRSHQEGGDERLRRILVP